MKPIPFKKLDDTELASLQEEIKKGDTATHSHYIRRGWKGPEIVSKVVNIPLSRAEKVDGHRAEQDALHIERIKALKPVIANLKAIWGKSWRRHLE